MKIQYLQEQENSTIVVTTTYMCLVLIAVPLNMSVCFLQICAAPQEIIS